MDECNDFRGAGDRIPDPHRVGGPRWIETSGGVLTWDQRRVMFAKSLATQIQLLTQRLSCRRLTHIDIESIMTLPDSRLVNEARQAALVQSPAILAHGYRTAVFARALAVIDGAKVDDEQLVVAGLLHDAGLVPAVIRQDFTVRSARIAADTARRAGRADVAEQLFDAICVHTTVGIDVERDGALGAYTQFGAMVDLAGLRERHLPHDLVSKVVADYPRSDFVPEILSGLRAEARAVPGGRFSFLRCVGFGPAVRIASIPSRR